MADATAIALSFTVYFKIMAVIRIKAFSISELLIAMSLGALISLSLGELYQKHYRAYQYQVTMLQANHSAILASLQLQSALQQAGYVGCLSLQNQHITVHDARVIMPIQAVLKQRMMGSDAVQLSYLAGDHSALVEDMQSPHYLKLSSQRQYHVGDIMMVSNCLHADIFTVDDAHKKAGQQVIYTKADLSQYQQGDAIGLWMQPIFYVATTKRKSPDGQWISALYWHLLQGEDEELVAGVNDLKIALKEVNATVEQIKIEFNTREQDEIFRQIVNLHWQFDSYVDAG